MIAFSTKDPKDMTVEELNQETAKYLQQRKEYDEYLLANPPVSSEDPDWFRYWAAKTCAEIDRIEMDMASIQMKPAVK
jgi:hypothetical protein